MIDDLIELDAMINIADEVDLDLKEIGNEVVRGYDEDVRSRKTWMDEMDEALKLTLQVMEKKNHPWEGASNVKVPLLTEAAMNYDSMMLPALVPQDNIVKGRVIGFDPQGQKLDSSNRVAKHMSYQIHEEMEDWEEEMDLGLMVQPIMGNMYKKTLWDFTKARPSSGMLTPKDFVFDYNAKSVEEAWRKTHVIPMTANDIKKRILAGEFLDEDLQEPVQEDKQKLGESQPAKDDSTPYDVLECHTYWDIDDDGLMEPYIITVEHRSKKVLRIVSGYDVDEIETNIDGEVTDVPQLQYFTKYGFIPNPDGGSLDLGLGKLLGPTNHAVNTLINQLIDAGTKSNMGGGFVGRGLKIRGGKLKFSMGEYKRVDSSGPDIAKNFYTIPTNEPSSVLFNLLSFLVNAGQRLSNTQDLQAGENPGQNQKATTSSIVQQNGLKIFSGIYKRCHRSLKKELKKIYYWNSKFLSAEDYINVLDFQAQPDEARLLKTLDYDVSSKNIIPAADAKFTSQEMKLMKAQALLQKIQTGLVNPQVAMARVLEAEEQEGIDQIMNVPQRQPSPEEIEINHKIEYEWAQFQLDVIKAEQEDVKINANAIKAMADAEGVETGQQLDLYKAQLDSLTKRSQELGQRAASLKTPAQGRGAGVAEPTGQ